VPGCMRVRCDRPALTWWWQLCLECTDPLLLAAEQESGRPADQTREVARAAAEWARRFAPLAYGRMQTGDEWVWTVRCLAMASLVSGKASGCAHTVRGRAGVPTVVIPRATGVLRCPACAESVVSQSSVQDSGCDRCGEWDDPVTRVCLTSGTTVIVAQLCGGCSAAAREPAPA
jgi:hypothetical protein